MFYFLLGVHIVISLLLILVILSQSSKGGALGGAFGGAASTASFGDEAETILKKWTKYFILLFVVSCLALAFYTKNLNSKVSDAEVSKELQKELAK